MFALDSSFPWKLLLQICSPANKFLIPKFAMTFSIEFLPYTDFHSKTPLYYTTLHTKYEQPQFASTKTAYVALHIHETHKKGLNVA